MLPAVGAGVLLFLLNAGGQETVPQSQVFRAGTTGVVLDVVIRDRRGRPVRDIRPDEVAVLEDGVARGIRSFRLIERNGAPAGADGAAVPNGAADALQSPTLVTIVFDHLTQNGRTLARRAARQFVAGEMPPNQWVAVFWLDQRLRLEQPFSRDAAALTSAIDRATTGSTETRDRLAGTQGDRETADRAALAAERSAALERPTVDTAAVGAAVTEARVAEVMARMTRLVEAADVQQRGQSTLFPLMALMKAQASLAGRKALLFFSEGFAIPPNLEEAYRSAISEANRANVSIYAVDARGLDTGRALEQSRQMLDRSSRNSQSQLAARASQRPVTLDDVMNSEVAEGALRADSQNALRALAEETSGVLIGNTNDLGPDLIARVRADLDSYYEVGYSPAESPADGRFRTLDVKVRRPGVSVHSRSGYFALPETDASPLLPYELPMLMAAAGSPPPQHFDYAVSVFRFGQSANAVQHTLIVEVPLERLTFEENRRNRTYSLKFTTLALLRDHAGQVVQRFSESYPLEGPWDRVAALKRGRLRFKRQFAVAPGRYVLSIVARDQIAERSSVTSVPLDVPEPTPGIRLSDLSIIRSVEQTADAPDAVEDPFRTATMRVAPNLGLSVSKATNSQISAYVTIYPEGDTPKPELTFEFILDGSLVGRSSAELPVPDDSGRIKFVATFPVDSFLPGSYVLRAIATQAGVRAISETRFTLLP